MLICGPSWRDVVYVVYTEPVFLKVYGAHEPTPRNDSARLCSLAGRYDNPIPTRFLAPIDSSSVYEPIDGHGNLPSI